MTEWFMVPVLKTGVRKYRGFESLSLRIIIKYPNKNMSYIERGLLRRLTKGLILLPAILLVACGTPRKGEPVIPKTPTAAPSTSEPQPNYYIPTDTPAPKAIGEPELPSDPASENEVYTEPIIEEKPNGYRLFVLNKFGEGILFDSDSFKGVVSSTIGGYKDSYFAILEFKDYYEITSLIISQDGTSIEGSDSAVTVKIEKGGKGLKKEELSKSAYDRLLEEVKKLYGKGVDLLKFNEPVNPAPSEIPPEEEENPQFSEGQNKNKVTHLEVLS